ncbi:hypothetical protein T12_5056, partial [Trichinella patagoniensis]
RQSQVIILQTHNNAYLWIGAETESQHYVHSECNATGFTSGTIPLRNGQSHLLKVDPASTGTCAMRLSRGGPRSRAGGRGAAQGQLN